MVLDLGEGDRRGEREGLNGGEGCLCTEVGVCVLTGDRPRDGDREGILGRPVDVSPWTADLRMLSVDFGRAGGLSVEGRNCGQKSQRCHANSNLRRDNCTSAVKTPAVRKSNGLAHSNWK